jgi:hypothetical protein
MGIANAAYRTNTNSQQQLNNQKQQLKTSVVSHNRSTRKSVPTKEKVPMAKTKQGKIHNRKCPIGNKNLVLR